ncbi:MAG: malectin domain-containing carbohydrate-binding protein, partial [Bacteroidota bacterium]
ALYQSERWSATLAYAIPVPNGDYTVTLHFADIYSGTQGVNKRVFDVLLEGETVLPALDIYQRVGGYSALAESFPVSVTDGVLDLTTNKIIENPKLSAIAIVPGCSAGVRCNDGDPCTTEDVFTADCGCAGTPVPDTDNDGVCDLLDQCPGQDDTVVGPDCADPLMEVVFRARMLQGQSDQMRLLLDGTEAGRWTVAGSSWQLYQTQIPRGEHNVRLWFRDQRTDVEVDWLEIDGTRYQTEEQFVNTSVWQNRSCGGNYSSRFHCRGYVEFGTLGTLAGKSAPALPKSGVSTTELRVYPNPVRDAKLTLAFTAVTTTHATVELFATTGQRVSMNTLPVSRGDNQLTVELGTDLPQGVYLLRFAQGGETVTRRLFVR